MSDTCNVSKCYRIKKLGPLARGRAQQDLPCKHEVQNLDTYQPYKYHLGMVAHGNPSKGGGDRSSRVR